MKALFATIYVVMAMSLLILVVMISGCNTLSPELIEALAKDNASFCATTDIRGGAGATIGALGYGQATLSFCRSNHDNAKLTLQDGSISIQHGEVMK